ncbi:MAG TPA: hypothetical protein VI603_11270 [Saprospiraceae bacterium]|nr:hypothetical protein [Saprospiraceae bacterium]
MESPLRINPAKTAGLLFTPAPDQYTVLDKSMDANRIWISGQDLTKRHQTLIAMCWNAALGGETSLICVTPEMRGKVQDMLKSAGMHGLYFDLAGQADSAVIGAFQVARRKKASEATSHQAEVALNEFMRWTTQQEQGYQHLEKVLFGELSWKEIVDQRSSVAGSAYQHFLTSAVKDKFDLTHKEYWHLRGRLKSFARLRTLRTPGFEILDALNPAMFDDPDASLKEKVVADLKHIIAVGRGVLCTVADAIHAYRKDVTSDHQWRSGEITARLSRVLQLIAAGETKFGQRFFDESTLSNTWHALIKSARADIQSLQMARNEIREAFLEFHNYLQECNDAHLGDAAAFMPDPLTIDSIKNACAEISEMLLDWSRRVDAHATQHKKRINAQNISRGEDLRTMIRTAEGRIEEFITLLSETQILKSIPEINALSIEKKAAVIEATVRLCLRLVDAAPDLDAYTLWTGFWSAQHSRTKAVLRCLDLMEDSDIVQAFDTWYFGLTLAQIPDHAIVSEKSSMLELHPQMDDLRAALEGHIRALVQTRRHDVLREIAPIQKALLLSIVKSHLNTFTDELRILPAKDLAELFPILICNQEQVTEYAYYFDTLYVLTDEGHDYKSYAAQSRRCVMITQAPPKFALDQWTITSQDIAPLDQALDWRSVSTSERLPFLEALASQFAPFLNEMRVYNARGIQIFSFLGDRIDSTLMQRLGMPYKEVGDHGLKVQLLVESFLDRRKPIVLLLRDNKLGETCKGYLPWHRNTIAKLAECGIRVCNLWSLQLKNAPLETLEQIYEAVRSFAEESNAAALSTLSENPILERHAQPESHAMEQLPEDPQPRSLSSGF